MISFGVFQQISPIFEFRQQNTSHTDHAVVRALYSVVEYYLVCFHCCSKATSHHHTFLKKNYVKSMAKTAWKRPKISWWRLRGHFDEGFWDCQPVCEKLDRLENSSTHVGICASRPVWGLCPKFRSFRPFSTLE